MRFFRSSAFAKAAKFRFEASCSAADAMENSPLRHARMSASANRVSPKPRDRLRPAKMQAAACSCFRPIDSFQPGRSMGRPPPRGSPLLGCGCFRQLHRSPGLLNLFDSRLGSTGDVEVDLGLQLAAAQQTHAVLGAADDTGLDERIDRHGLLGVELLGVDRRLDATKRDFVVVLAEDVLEATL